MNDNDNINTATAAAPPQPNSAEEYNPFSYTFITTYRVATEERKRRGATDYTRVLTCEVTQESGQRYYHMIIMKDIHNITCQLADVGDSEGGNYAQIKITMTDDFIYAFNFRYNHNAKAFYEELFDEVFLP